MTTPIPSAVYPRAVLALTMGLSTWLNTTHAAVAYPGQSWRWAILAMSAIPPLAVPVLIELVGREARRGGATAAFRGAMGAAVLLTLIAFAVSVWAITSLGMQWGMPLAVAAAFPLVLDLGAAVATTFLLDRAAAEARAAELDEVHQPPEQADAPAYPATLTWLAPVHQTAVAAPEPLEQAGAPAVTSDDETVHHTGALVHQEAETAVVHTAERPRLAAVHRADAPVQSEAVQPVRQRTEPVQSPVVQPVHLEQAAAVVQSGGIELAVERVAEIFARKDSGQSQNEIANSKVAAKRTISKVLARREELEPAFA